MSSKWADEDEKDDAGNGSPLTPNSPPSEHKDSGGGGRRSRRPRPGRGDIDAAAAEKDRPPVKTVAGGWELDGAGSTEAQRKTGGQTTIAQQKPIEGGTNRANRRNHFDNEETEILVIPDLEDEGEEDVETKVAAAPQNTTRRVPSLRELDEDLKYAIPSGADGLDMSLLTKTLVPPEMLEEDDSPWEFDSLLQSVTQEFNAEKRLAFHAAKLGTDEDGSTATSSTFETFERRSSSQEQGGSRRSSRALVA
ncbi:unnamed protein product [Ectocarpus fasciculatus]